jgi:hypothetical protein
MLSKIKRLFIIKTRFEVFLITYALALGASERGKAYLMDYPGTGGWLLFIACHITVIMAAAKMLDAVQATTPKVTSALVERRGYDRRQGTRTVLA